MQAYRNRSGKSPIERFATGPGFIRVWFRGDPTAYRYSNHLTELKRFAREGRGLATFINRNGKNLRFTRG